jgi:cysteinyl-tRNA synthetase
MPSLFLYDTMIREKRLFEPADPGRVTMYVCGPTVYNYAHIGNFRPVVVFDVLFRLLRRLYGEEAVVYARNFTDVDDRINAASIEQGVPIGAITERFTAAYHEDTDALGALRPTLEPRATAHIPQMVDLIGRLVRAQKAYAAEGHVLFDVAAFADYGRLSKRSLDDMIAGARVEVAPYKRNPADFVLWKPSKPGEPAWDSPFGPGRPGWHLECSAMIEAALGDLPIDIHGGGLDLIFPHHENEIAQSVCAHDGSSPLARYWMHNGFLDMAGEKMSKSLGNVVLMHDLKALVPGEVIRWALLSAHYRQPLSWTERLVNQSRNSLDRLYGVLQRAKEVEASASVDALDPLFNDLDTPGAFAALSALASDLDKAVVKGSSAARTYKGKLLGLAQVLGVLQADPDAWFQGSDDEDLKSRIEALVAARDEARRDKDWAEADRLRAELTALGVEIMDGPGGATWRFKPPPAA